MHVVCVYRYLPREVDPLVYNMSVEDPGDVTFNQIGGLGEQVRELREVSGIMNQSVILSPLLVACGTFVVVMSLSDWPFGLSSVMLKCCLCRQRV